MAFVLDALGSACGRRATGSPAESSLSLASTGVPSDPERDIQHRDGAILSGKVELSSYVAPASLEMPPRQDAKVVDARDADTPDNWVMRHENMVRLTGRHPFNSEPPMKDLQEAGWITPPSLHVVRNHGAVPKLSWESHRLVIEGVPRPCELTMEELASGKVGEIVSIPVSFICAGNRRKEQNMTKKTIGFNWGSGAIANSIWTGVRLCDLLAYVGIPKASAKHRFVHFEGPLGELPQGKTGSYGTSIDMGWAMDRERDVLLAFKQNGELLTPDHGAPLRTLLPGCIGGRMIKWLCKMWVSDQPSESHYHFFDNRVLPPHVDAELATAEGWWYKDEYIINHFNINSAMFEPRHNAVFHPSKDPTLRVSGYAYAGGGLKVIRAEISLDEGKSWEITDLTRPEDEIAASRGTDKHWCWGLWETEVDSERLRDCHEIACRAVDCNQNMQPANLTWNVMGMCNNCLFRIRVHHRDDGSVWFEHPTQPGAETGGWMTEDAGRFDPARESRAARGARGVAPKRPVAAVFTAPQAPEVQVAKKEDVPGRLVKDRWASIDAWMKDGVPQSEVEKHNNDKCALIVVKDRVYDCTPYLEDHPGGASSILLLAGGEATEDFEAVHSKKAWATLEDYFIGKLREGGSAGPKEEPKAELELDPSQPFLHPRKAQKLPLVEKIVVSHDTRIFRFGLPHPQMRLGLPTGCHMFLRAKISDETVMRPYSPMTDDETLGHVDLLVKVYFKGVHPKFPDGGKMSQHLESMQIGDSIDVKGPLGEFIYKGPGSFTWMHAPRQCQFINMIAGGTGLTPCNQVAQALLRNAEDPTQVRLLYANQSPADILMRKELDDLAARHPDRFQVWYTVDRAPEGEEWKYDVGFISEAMIREHLFPAGEGTITVMCGPPPMVNFACKPNLKKLGHEDPSLMVF